ncbi:protein terminus-like [Haematobia irritans]|uniref:protein terminus-like n=1 Tax=Haematobia irritans TaxID=7368 RepID=UPI003F4F59AB
MMLLLSMPISSYSFVTTAGQRKFVHSWHYENNEVIECNKCSSSCKETDAYGKHWIQPKTLDVDANDNDPTAINRESDATATMGMAMIPTKSHGPTIGPTTIIPVTAMASSTNGFAGITSPLMDHREIIVSRNIESFMLCDDTKTVSDSQQFLLDAGIKAIPDLLSAVYAMRWGLCLSLGVVLRFYVKIKGNLFRLQTTELLIRHHFDIRESVDMMFSMLLEKLKRLLDGGESIGAMPKNFTIQRMNIKVQRYRESQPALPLQYARKQNPREGPSQSVLDLALLNSWFRQHLLTSQHLNGSDPPFPCNLYTIQQCQNSLELYVVPYYLESQSKDSNLGRNFAILCDISGYFLGLQEISNIRRFLHHSWEDRLLECPHCQEKFVQHSKLHLHKMLNCGQGFEFVKIDSDSIEIYEHCWLFEKSKNWSLFGILE